MNLQSSMPLSLPTPAQARQNAVDQAAGSFELSDLLRILSERRNIIIAGAVLGLVLGLLTSFLMTPLYRATALIEINSEASQVLDQAKGSTAPQRMNTQELVGTTVGLLKSEALARRVAQDLNLANVPQYGGTEGSREQRLDRAAAVVQGGTDVFPVKSSMLVQIRHTMTDPQLAAKIANALGRGFISSSLERRYDSSSYARDFLKDQLARTKTAIEQADRQLNAYAISSGVFRTPGQVVDGRTTEGTTLAVDRLAAMNKALNDARVSRIAAEQAFRSARLGVVADTAAKSLTDQRAAIQSEYDQRAKLFKPEYPQMQQLAAQIARLDAAIAATRNQSTSSRRGELEGEYEAALRAESALQAQVNASKREVQAEEGRSVEYNILKREADTNRALYDALLQRYKEIGVAGGIGQSNVALVDEAEPPQGPYRPNLMVNAAVGILAGIVLGVALAFATHLLFDNIVTAHDVRQKLHLPVLGVIPLETAGVTLMEALSDRKSDVSEAYYSVRTALRFSRPEGPPRSLLVTSTRPGEGKSTSAYAIASSMARLGSRVLLIDADLRKPTFVSSREDGYGLAHLLGTDEPISAYTEATQVENLDLLPVGRYVGSAAELLSSSRLPALIDEAGRRYEMVVIDGPPVLGLADAPLLASVAQATAIVIESRESRTANIVEMLRRLTDAGGNVLGAILTKVTRSGGAYGYDYYSYSYGDDRAGGKVSSDPARALDLGRTGA